MNEYVIDSFLLSLFGLAVGYSLGKIEMSVRKSIVHRGFYENPNH